MPPSLLSSSSQYLARKAAQDRRLLDVRAFALEAFIRAEDLSASTLDVAKAEKEFGGELARDSRARYKLARVHYWSAAFDAALHASALLRDLEAGVHLSPDTVSIGLGGDDVRALSGLFRSARALISLAPSADVLHGACYQGRAAVGC